MVRSRDPDLQAFAASGIDSLVEWRPEVEEALLDFLRPAEDAGPSEAAALRFLREVEEMWPSFLVRMKDSREDVREQAARCLCWGIRLRDLPPRGPDLGAWEEPVLRNLLWAATDPEAAVRVWALRALACLGGRPDEVLPALAAGLDDPLPAVRAEAADALRTLGPVAIGRVGRLGGALADPDAGVRESAVRAVLRVAGGSPDALARPVEGPAPGAAIVPSVREALRAVLRDGVAACALAALRAFAELPPLAEEEVRDVRFLCGHGDPDVRAEARMLLRKVEDLAGPRPGAGVGSRG